jgi:hypothetical protein
MPSQHSPARWALAYLISQDVVRVPAGGGPPYAEAWVGTLPGGAPYGVGLFDTTGVADGRLQGTGRDVHHYGIQCLVRGPYEQAYTLAQQITQTLTAAARAAVTIGAATATIHSILLQSGPTAVGLDPTTNRPQWTVNYLATITEN